MSFARVHRSVILNLAFVEEFAKDFGGGYIARMKDPEKNQPPRQPAIQIATGPWAEYRESRYPSCCRR